MLEQNQTNFTQEPVQNEQVNCFQNTQQKRNLKLFNILNWVFIGVSAFIFCMVTIIVSIFFYLYSIGGLDKPEDPHIYKLLVTGVTFVIMDLCFMVIWLGLIHVGLYMGYKKKNLTSNKKLFVILNASFLIIFFLINVAIVALLVVWLGGYVNDSIKRIGCAIAVGSLECVKALIMIATLVVAIKVLKRNRKIGGAKTI
ncbi:MAG: hypothetical protein KBS35_01905 [Mycoplasma sp.]|nr:hypothetical protein [Candidatus Hennigella equi]